MGSSEPAGRPVTLTSLILPAYVPPTLFSIGQGAIAPVVVISAAQLGASPAQSALVVGAAGVGQLVADIPAGALAARFGDRKAMVGAGAITSAALVLCMIAPSLLLFTAGIFGTGMGTAVWLLARQAYVAHAVPFELRARAMSTLGGVYRIGLFLGPFVGGLVIVHTSLAGAYAVHIVACVLAVTVLLLAPDVAQSVPTVAPSNQSSWSIVTTYRSAFRTVGVGILLVNAVRAARQVVVPLWGTHIGLDASTIAVIFGISGAVDMLLFYPAGRAMDRWGRVAGAVPAMVVLAIGHVLLPFTHSAGTLLAASMVLGLGNGASSGLVMTLGADLAPAHARARFLGIWRLLADLGNGAGPLALSAMTALVSLGVGIASFGVLGLGTAALLSHWIPRRGIGAPADRTPEPPGPPSG